jgi:hypothetical protein
VAADAPTTDGSITPVRDNTRWPKQSETQFFKNTPMTQTALANQTGGAVASFCIFLLTTNALLRKRLSPPGREWTQAIRPTTNASWPDEIKAIAGEDWQQRARETIYSTGFVVHTLEAALWAVDTTDSFPAAVLKAVNLGDDADSVGAVAGQLAGARYGLSAIPVNWRNTLIHQQKIESLGQTLFRCGQS